MRRLLSALGMASIALMSTGPSAAIAQSAAAEISILPTPQGVEIKGSVIGLSEGEVTATMAIVKSDSAGTSNLTQARAVEVRRGDRHIIGQTTLSIQPGGTLSVELSVMQDGAEIATAASTFEP
ncbi:curli-like amyloid fiber formation chaperone CsgH [Phaeobacter gallaeciensis]|nr:curli-like amyloid fiber formation chaperone CsgH [Phaeobacter gallaeciensis]